MSEPQLEAQEIQGNILCGFNKNWQCFLGLAIDGVTEPGRMADPTVRAVKEWLLALLPQIATMDQVAAHNRWFREQRRKNGKEPVSEQVWRHIAFTYEGICKLAGAEGEAFTHVPFRLGMARRSSFLGDPTDPTAAGHPSQWVVGGPGNPIDILLIIASDSRRALDRQQRQIEQRAHATGIRVVYRELGQVRTDRVDGLDMRGHEHFGFKDGVSQPSAAGWFRLPDGTEAPVTRRHYPAEDPAGAIYAAPGEPLIQPGQFVFGYPLQDIRKPQGSHTLSLPAQGVPAWARNGSFLAFRRLRQDVALFRETVADLARAHQVSPDWLGARMVGRWQSGAPVMRSPERDDRRLGADAAAVNNFQFANPGMADLAGHVYPQSQPDPLGLTCPVSAHIRKVNPRDEGTDVGSMADTMARRIIRRGLPYGDPLPPERPDLAQADRGLLFVSYQTSLEEQFEFLHSGWMNRTAVPNPGGHDPLVGQNGLDADRERCFFLRPGAAISGLPDFVIPTGGAYLFSPSITALRAVLGR